MKQRYFVFVRQKAEGCDYTIGCGCEGFFLEAEDTNEIRRYVDAWYGKEDWAEILVADASDMASAIHEKTARNFRDAKDAFEDE